MTNTDKNDFNATIGNTVLCDGFLIPMTDFVLKLTEQDEYSAIEILDKFADISRYAMFLKQPLKLEMFVPCDEDGNVLDEQKFFYKKEALDILSGDDFGIALKINEKTNAYRKAKEKILFEGFEPYEDYECAKYEEVYVDEEVCDGKFTVEDLIKDAGKTKIKLSQIALDTIFGKTGA